MAANVSQCAATLDYLKRSGGYFADATIHDIDLLCWITGEQPTEVFATGSCMVAQRWPLHWLVKSPGKKAEPFAWIDVLRSEISAADAATNLCLVHHF